MAELNNIPDTDDTKTRVTAKITDDTPGKNATPIDLQQSAPAADSSTMTRRTMKLAGLAGLAGTTTAAPAADAPVAQAPAADTTNDTRTRRTIKLTGLAAAPAVSSLNLKKPQSAAAPAEKVEAKPASMDTVTRRTQKLEALDTKDVIAMTEADISGNDTNTQKTIKVAAPVSTPAPQAAAPATPTPRQTVKVDGIAPIHTPAIDLNAKPSDTNTRKTVKLSIPEISAPQVDINAPAGDDDTRTRNNVKVTAKKEAPQFKAANVDDTVKLQRPAPKPVMPGSVAPATQAGTSAVGGIKLNKPAPKTAVKPGTPATSGAAPAPGAPAAPAAPAPKQPLTANTAALPTGKSPDLNNGMPSPIVPLKVKAKPGESMLANVTFAFFGVVAFLLLIFVTLIAVTDHFNVWVKEYNEERIVLPIVSDYIDTGIEDSAGSSKIQAADAE